jgi:hypothetical protein
MGIFASVLTLLLALYRRPKTSDYFIFFWTMILMSVVGVLGFGLHINVDLPEGGRGIVLERFIRGAPPLAPLLFANMGILGIITMVGAETFDEEKVASPKDELSALSDNPIKTEDSPSEDSEIK